jgi:hypothetical protein
MTQDFQPGDRQRFEAAIRRFDEENARDPNCELVDGQQLPRELVYSRWLTDWVVRLAPNASEPLRLAARAQHLCRWMIPRDSHPMTRAGYLRWREALKHFHARRAGELLQEVGSPPETVTRVQTLIRKENFPDDPEVRVLEDALCLVFLERQFRALADKSTPDKMVNALRKAWKKMTPAAQALALKLPHAARERALLDQALASGG